MRWLTRLLWAIVAWRFLGPVLVPRFPAPQEHPWRIPGRTIFVGDREFLVREMGDSGSPVVLIHGLGGSSLAEWYRVAPMLAERHRVVMIDHRSHGLSAVERSRYEVEEAADELAAVLDLLGIREAGVIGYSMGGALALALAHRRPDLVAKLGLVATMAAHPDTWRWVRTVGTYLQRGWERLTGLGAAEVRSSYLLKVGAVEQRHSRWLWDESHRRDPDAYAEAALALFRFDARPILDEVLQPSLVVIPTNDQLVPPPWQYQLASGLKDVMVVEIDGARHELPWTHAELLAQAVEDLLAS
ncbi:MAG TPA: alpha/beta hydrolase [Acidimicrobiia bacterium]|jgi:pimeloyl-ACP methyl ester carboxylesterase